MKATIDKESDSNYPMMWLTINGHKYGFSVKGFPEKDYDWLCDVFTRNMVDAFEQGRNCGKLEIIEPIKKALNFLY